MHNTLAYTMTEIFHSIPMEVMEIGFPQNPLGPPTALSERVYTAVIVNRIALRCNLNGGKIKDITLHGNWWERTNNSVHTNISNLGNYAVYRIPPEERDNLPIIGVNHISPPAFYGNVGYYGGPHSESGVTVPGNMDAMLSSHTGHNRVITPMAEVLSGDLIRLDPPMHSHQDWRLSVKIAYDEGFNNLNASAVEAFGRMAVAATKAYIYNTLVISIDRGYIMGGAEIGTIKDIVSEYREENARYEELVTDFASGARLDPGRVKTFLAYML